MTITLIILGLILSIIGLLGSFLPVLPGPLLNYIALILLQFTSGHPFSTSFLIFRGLIIVIVTILDYVIPVIGTKRYGGTKSGVTGSTIGLAIAMMILPILGITIGPFGLIGLVGGPFVGAYIGEKIGGKTHHHALRSAFGSFLGFAAGTIIKFIICIIMTIYFSIQAYHLIRNMF